MKRVRFGEVSRTVAKEGICPICKKSARRSKKFYQTINPWNVDKFGTRKDRTTIEAELRLEIDAWMGRPIFHKSCSYLN